MAMNSTTKAIVIGGSVLVGVLVLGIVGKKMVFKLKQNRTKKDQDKLAQIQNDTNLATETETADGYNPNSDVELLGGYVLGSNFMYYPDEVNEIVFKLSDIELKKLADAWKKQNGVSLYKSLDDEWDSCGWWFSNCYDSAMSRLSKLGKR